MTFSAIVAIAAGGCGEQGGLPQARSGSMLQTKLADGATTTKFDMKQSPETVVRVLDQLVKTDRSFEYDANKFLGGGGAYQGTLLCKTRDGGRFYLFAERVAADKTDVHLTTTLGEFARTELIERLKSAVEAAGG